MKLIWWIHYYLLGGEVSLAFPVFVEWLQAYAEEKSRTEGVPYVLRIKQPFASIKNYRAHPEFQAPDIIAASDLEDLAGAKTIALNDLIAAHRLLRPAGMMFLSVYDKSFQFPPAPMLTAAASSDPAVKTTLKMANVLPENIWGYFTQLVPVYIERNPGLREIMLSLSLPMSSESGISQEDLQYFASLLFPHIRFSVRLFPNVYARAGDDHPRGTMGDTIVERVRSLTEPQDVVFCREYLEGGSVEDVFTCVEAIHAHTLTAGTKFEFEFENRDFTFAWRVTGTNSETSRMAVRMLAETTDKDERTNVAQAQLINFYKDKFPACEIFPIPFTHSFERFPQTGALFIKLRERVFSDIDEDADEDKRVEKFSRFITDIKAALFTEKSATEKAANIERIAASAYYLGHVSWVKSVASFFGAPPPVATSLESDVKSILAKLKASLIREAGVEAAPRKVFGAGAGV